MAQLIDINEQLRDTPTPFYINAAFHRLCRPEGDCDFCCFSAEEDDWASDMVEGRVCPENLWWYVTQREKVMQKFDASHPPTCPFCNKQMVADRTITLGDKDVTAFSCNHCHKIERSSRYYVEWDRHMLKHNPEFFAQLDNNNKTEGKPE